MAIQLAKKFVRLSWNMVVHYHVHNTPSLESIVSQFNTFYTRCLSCPSGILISGSDRDSASISQLPYAFYASFPSHP
jgi:hypothetical protein